MSTQNLEPLIGERVVVTGMAGAGKSTFSRTLAEKSNLPLIHLDLHIWNPGWVRVTQSELTAKQHELLAPERWIVDSNDVDDDILIDRADTLVVLATPWWICSWRAFKRGLQRPPGTQLPEGCEESHAQRLKDEWGIVFRNWRNRVSVPQRDRALAARCREHMRVHILHTRNEMDDFVRRV